VIKFIPYLFFLINELKKKIKVYIVNRVDDFYLGIDMSGRPVYPIKKMMYASFNDSTFVFFLREGQNRKKLTKKIISELVGYSSPYLLNIDGDILNSYEVA